MRKRQGEREKEREKDEMEIWTLGEKDNNLNKANKLICPLMQCDEEKLIQFDNITAPMISS